MLKLKYFPIPYCVFTLMPAVAWAADSAQETEVTVYYGRSLNDDNLKSEKIAFPNEGIVVRDFVNQCWDTYLKKINQSLEIEGILTDFGENTENVKASDLIVAGVYIDSTHGLSFMGYNQNLAISDLPAKVGIMVCSIDKIEDKTLDKIPQEYHLNNLIAAAEKDKPKSKQKQKPIKEGKLKSEQKQELQQGAKDEQEQVFEEEQEHESKEQEREEKNESKNKIPTSFIVVAFVSIVIIVFYEISSPKKKKTLKKVRGSRVAG